MSVSDQMGEPYRTATAKALRYKYTGWFPEAKAL
jgi:hypothetical protein